MLLGPLMLAVLRKTLGDHRFELADMLADLGGIRHGQGRLVDAERLMLEQFPTIRELNGGEGLFFHLEELVSLLLDDGKLPEAEEASREEQAFA